MIRSFFIISLMCISYNAFAADSVKPVFDDRQWSLSWSNNKDDGTIFEEYTVGDEKVENWSELISIQFFPGLNKNVNLDVYEASTKINLTRACPGIIWNSHYQQEFERMWSWSIINCPGQKDQSEIARAVTTDKGIHVFHYAVKVAPIPPLEYLKWSGKLREIRG